MKCFRVKEFFSVNFDYKNACKDDFQDNNENSCSWFKNRVPKKNRESHPTAWELTILV